VEDAARATSCSPYASGELRDPRRRKVAPEYRQVVDDYFRAVSE